VRQQNQNSSWDIDDFQRINIRAINPTLIASTKDLQIKEVSKDLSILDFGGEMPGRKILQNQSEIHQLNHPSIL